MNQGPGFDLYGHLARAPDASAACPLCRGIGGVQPHRELGVVCRLCGAPRVVMPEGVALDEGVIAGLRKADAARKSRGLFQGLAIVGVVGTLFGLLLALPTAFFSLWVSLLFVLFIVAPSVAMTLFARARASAKTREVAASLDAAFGAATAELVAGGKAKTAADVAKLLGIDHARAQQLFTMVGVEAEIGGSTGLRIDAPPSSTLAPDPRFAELEARALAEQQAEAESAGADANAQATERAK